jgi:hypothetical protein
MSKVERITRSKNQNDGMTRRIKKKECNKGDKMLMNSLSMESFKYEEKTTMSHLPFNTGVITL